MQNYSGHIKSQPQTKPIFGRTDMVQNNAGGYGFKITPQQLLERFLLIGSEGGTYYVGEQKLTEDNAKNIVEMIKKDGLNVVNTVLSFSEEGRAPKADALIFTLALAATYGDAVTKKASYDAIQKVCYSATQLFMFLANIQNLRGWSRGLRKGVSKFYTSRSNDQIAYQLVKYRNRAGFTHKDAIKLSHPTAKDDLQNSLFKYAIGKLTESEVDQTLIKTFGKVQSAKDKDLLALIAEGKLTWEMVPTDQLNNADVLKALLPNMPLTALMRNLNRFSYNGLTESNNETVKKIVSKLTNYIVIQKSNIHPINVINSMITYSSGQGQRGDKTWKANQNIVDALAETYEKAVQTLLPTNKNILIGVDISGSMNTPVGGMQLTASQIANVLAVTMMKSEKNAELVWFDDRLRTAEFGRRTSIDEVIKRSPNGGGTDCSLPFVHAANNLTSYDAIIILTDSETWAGQRHGLEILNSYRKNVNRDVKVIEIALAANPHSTMPGDDPNLLRIVGFDSSVTDLVNEFIK